MSGSCKEGDLLIAPPNMPDPRFHNSVIIIVHNDASGSSGFCLNKILEPTINDIIKEIDLDANLPFPLFWGGPVNSTSVWMIHSSEWQTEHTLTVNDQWSITSSKEMFHCLANGDCPRHFRFCHGMSSWAPGQLDKELDGEEPWDARNSWLTLPDSVPEWVFEQPESRLWTLSTIEAGKTAVDAWL